MAKFVRYSLVAVCFAASVACLALWGRSYDVDDSFRIELPAARDPNSAVVLSRQGIAMVILGESTAAKASVDWQSQEPHEDLLLATFILRTGLFGTFNLGAYFPLWYPALIFALAGVVALRFRRQFSIRSALVATTAIAALIAMAAIL